MNKINSEDNLEALFGKMFNNQEEVGKQEGWNVPSEGVWDNIHAELQAEKKPRSLLFIQPSMAVAASFLLLVGCFKLYQYSQQINQLSHQVAVHEQKVGTMQSDLKALVDEKAQKVEEIQAHNEEPAISKMEVSVQDIQAKRAENIYSLLSLPVYLEQMENQKESISPTYKVATTEEATDKIEKTNNSKILKSTNKNPLKKQQPEWNAWAVSNEKIATNQENNLATKEVDNTVTSFQKRKEDIHFLQEKLTEKTTATLSIAKLPTLSKSIKTNKKLLPPNLNAITPSYKNKSDFYVATSYAPLWEENKTKGSLFKEVGTFSSAATSENSFTCGLQLGANLGKGWALETGLRFNKSNTSIDHTGTIPYHLLEENLTSQGKYESTVNLPLAAAGTVETTLVFSRNAASVLEEDTDLQLQIASSKTLTSVDIPLLVKRQWAVGNLGLSIRAGLLNRFILQNNFDPANIVVEDSRFQAQVAAIQDKQEPTESITYSTHLVAGLGIEYFLYPRLSVYAEPTFTRSLTANENFDLANVYTEGKMVDLGVRYQL